MGSMDLSSTASVPLRVANPIKILLVAFENAIRIP
jgi:hypothetical protein